MNKLLLITDAWHPQTNGVVTTLSQIVQSLQARGIEVRVIHPALFPSIPCPTYPEVRLATRTGRIRTMIRDFAPDAIHIATEGPLGLAARRYLVKQGIPFQTSMHTKFAEYIHQRLPLIPVSWGYAFLRWFHRPAINVLVTTESMRQELTRHGLQNLTVWGRGVDTQLYRDHQRSRENTHPILLYVGRLAVEKNLEAFLQLDFPGEKWLVGDGPQRANLEKRYPQARYFGYRRGQELADLFAKADVFVFPSRTDTFGLVMLEAMACGTPVAAFPVTGPKDVVISGQTGCLHEDLETAVRQAIRIDRAQCRQHAEQHSWQACADRFLAAFQAPTRDSASTGVVSELAGG